MDLATPQTMSTKSSGASIISRPDWKDREFFKFVDYNHLHLLQRVTRDDQENRRAALELAVLHVEPTTSTPAKGNQRICTDCTNFLKEVISAFSDWKSFYGRLHRISRFKRTACCVCELICSQLPARRSAFEIQVGRDLASFVVYIPRRSIAFDRFNLVQQFTLRAPEYVLDSSPHPYFLEDVGITGFSQNNKLPHPLPRYATYMSPNSWSGIARILAWLKACLDHKSCRPATSQSLPSRVIDVGGYGSNRNPYLYESHHEKATYLTLSYCWGNESSLRLTQATRVRFMKGIRIESMPQTFQDAVHLTRLMGIRYLWIDALCIIQDDSTDFGIHSARMYEIYCGSLFTISATAFSGPSTGLFGRSRGSDSSIVDLSHLVPGQPLGKLFLATNKDNSIAAELSRGLTSSRGWCLQERLASPAVLHFLSDQMVWECSSCCTAEDGREITTVQFLKALDLCTDTKENFSFKADGHAGSQLSEIKLWHALVRDYTRRKLTKSTDRLVALAGLAAEFHTRISWLGCYLAGLWRNALPADLLWVVSRPWKLRDELNVIGALSHLPTWSWMRIDHLVDHITRIDEGTVSTMYDFVVYAVFLSHSSKFGPFASATTGAFIHGTGYLQQAVLVGDRLSVKGGKDLSIGYLVHVDQYLEQPRLCYILIVTTLVSRYGVSSERPVRTFYLLLESVGTGARSRYREFQRLGVAFSEWDKTQSWTEDGSSGIWSDGLTDVFPSLFKMEFRLV